MICSEFVSRFSEFYDAPIGAPERLEAEAHMASCEKCARYREVVSRSVALLNAMPKAELAESFRPRLQHRLFHLDDGSSVAQTGRGSATPAVTVLGMAILLTAVAWSPTIGSGIPEVALPAIVVSGPPMPAPFFDPDALRPTPDALRPTPDALRPTPVSSGVPASSSLFPGGLWSDAKSLLYEYSPMSERYRGDRDRGERLLRRTGLD
jgi:hypothetical protein